jgi:hypothetical protein
VQIHGKLKSALGVDIPLVELFQHSSVGALAAHLRKATTSIEPASSEERVDTRRELLARQKLRTRGRAEQPKAGTDGDFEDSND